MVSSLLMMKLILVDSSILVLAVAISPEQSSGLASGVLDSKVHRTFADWRHPMSFGCFLQMDFQTEGLQMNTRKMKNPLSMLRTPMMLKITLEW